MKIVLTRWVPRTCAGLGAVSRWRARTYGIYWRTKKPLPRILRGRVGQNIFASFAFLGDKAYKGRLGDPHRPPPAYAHAFL